MRRVAIASKILLWITGVFSVLLLGLVIASGSSPVLNWAFGKAQQALREELALNLQMERFSGNPFWRLTLNELELSQNGQLIAHMPEASFNISLWGLMRGELVINNLKLETPVLNLQQTLIDKLNGDAGAQPSSPPALRFNNFSISRGALNLTGVGLSRYSLKEINLSGDFRLRPRELLLNLSQGEALWQQDDLPAFALSGGLSLSQNEINFAGFNLALNGNQLSAQGRLNWRAQNADLNFTASLNAPLPGIAFLGAPDKPVQMTASVQGTAENWETKLAINQADSALELAGSLNPKAPQIRLKGTASHFYPERLGLTLPVSLRGLNLNGALALEGGLENLSFSLAEARLEQNLLGSLRAGLSWQAHLCQINHLELTQESGGSLRLSASLPRPWFSQKSSANLKFANFTLPRRLPMPEQLQHVVLNGQALLEGSAQDGFFSMELDKIILDAKLQPGTLLLKGNWRERALFISQGEFSAPWAKLNLNGQTNMNEMDVSLDFKLSQIRPLLHLLPAWSKAGPQEGGISGNLKAKGPLTALKLSFEVNGSSIKGDDFSAASLKLNGSLLLDTPPSGEASLNAGQLNLGGFKLNHLALEGKLHDGQGLIKLKAAGPSWQAALEASPLSPELSAWRLGNISFSAKQAWQQRGVAELNFNASGAGLTGLNLTSHGGQLELSLLNQNGQLQGSARLSEFDLSQLLAGNGASTHPRLNLQASLSGTSAKPLVEANGYIKASRNQEEIRLNFNGALRDEQALLNGQAQVDGHNVFTITAGAHLPMAGPVEKVYVRALADNLELNKLQPLLPGMGNLKGTLNINLNLSGNWPVMDASGFIRLRDASFSINPINMNVYKFNLWLECAPEGLLLQELGFRSGPGKVRAGGRIPWPWLREAALSLDLTAEDFPVKLPPWGQLIIDANLGLSGTWAMPALKGGITNKSAYATIFKTSHSDLDEVVEMQSEHAPPPLSFTEPEGLSLSMPAFLDGWRIDLSSSMAPDFRLSAPHGWLAVSGQSSVSKEPWQAPHFSGGYKIDGGVLIIFGTRVESIGGDMVFKNPESMFPELDLQASVHKGFTTITAKIKGSAFNPVLSVSSEPPMNQGDILSMLAFGKPVAELNQQEGANLSNQAMALALIGEKSRQELQNILGSTITPDVITVHNEIQYGASLEAGKYLTKDLYLRYRQGTDNTDSRSLGLEWRLTPKISLQGQVGTERDTGVDVIFHFVFHGDEEEKEASP